MAKKFGFEQIKKAEQQKARNLFNELNITIKEELRMLIPPLTAEEIAGLEQSIKTEGCREPIILWKDREENILIDGHNRYRICQDNNLPFKTLFKEFKNLDEVKDWMIDNQLSRRNLTELQKSYLRGLQYSREKKSVGGDKKKSSGQNDQMETREKLAQEHKVSPKTIQRDEKFALGLDKLTEGNKELKDKILNKTIKVPQSIIQEASGWDKKQIEQAKKALENNEVEKLTKAEKEPKEKSSEVLIKSITQKLKNCSYDILLKIEDLIKSS